MPSSEHTDGVMPQVLEGPGAAIAPVALRRRLVGGVVWSMAGAVAAQGSVFLSSIVTARILGHTGYGKLAILQNVFAMIGGFAAVGFGATSTKFVAELHHRDPERLGRILGLSALTTGLSGVAFAATIALGATPAARLVGVVGLERQLAIGAVYILFFTANTYQIGALVGLGAFRELARIGVIQGIVMLAVTAAGASAFGLTGATTALGLASVSSWLQHGAVVRAKCRRHGIIVTYSGLGRELNLLARFAAPAALSGCVGAFSGAAAILAVARQPSGVREMAAFGAANSIRLMVVFLPGLVSRVTTPLLCGLNADGRRSGFRQMLWRYLLANTAIAAGTAALVFALGPTVLRLFGREFVQARLTLGILLASSVAETVAGALFQTLYAHGRFWTQLAIASVWSAILVAVTWWWAPTHGAVALASGYLVAWLVSTTLYAAVTQHLLAQDAAPGRYAVPEG